MQDLDLKQLVHSNHELQLSLKMEQDTKVNGLREQIFERVTGFKYGAMAQNMKDGGQKTKQMDEAD